MCGCQKYPVGSRCRLWQLLVTRARRTRALCESCCWLLAAAAVAYGGATLHKPRLKRKSCAFRSDADVKSFSLLLLLPPFQRTRGQKAKTKRLKTKRRTEMQFFHSRRARFRSWSSCPLPADLELFRTAEVVLPFCTCAPAANVRAGRVGETTYLGEDLPRPCSSSSLTSQAEYWRTQSPLGHDFSRTSVQFKERPAEPLTGSPAISRKAEGCENAELSGKTSKPESIPWGVGTSEKTEIYRRGTLTLSWPH